MLMIKVSIVHKNLMRKMIFFCLNNLRYLNHYEKTVLRNFIFALASFLPYFVSLVIVFINLDTPMDKIAKYSWSENF